MQSLDAQRDAMASCSQEDEEKMSPSLTNWTKFVPLILANDVFASISRFPFSCCPLFPVSSHFRPPIFWVEARKAEESESGREREANREKETKKKQMRRQRKR